MKLSKNFSLDEFSRSDTAKKLKIDNTVPSSCVYRLKALCQHTLQPARDQLGSGIRITSGYRCPLLNDQVKGEKNSQHLIGEAADMVTCDGSTVTLMRLFLILMDGVFDQLIWYHKGSGYFIHVSYHDGPNRQQVLFKSS